MYESGQGIECCGCGLRRVTRTTFKSITAAYRHLLRHIQQGDQVPGHALMRLLDKGAVHPRSKAARQYLVKRRAH
jgi:hypothetical protein